MRPEIKLPEDHDPDIPIRNADCGIIWNQNTIDAEEEYTELFIWFRLSEKSHGSVWPNLMDQYLAEPAF